MAIKKKSARQAAPRPAARAHSRQVWSFFTGAMGLDLGLESVGLIPTLANEIDATCCATIRKNRPHLPLIEGDIGSLTAAKLRKAANFRGDVFLMVGGPPCQSFSSGGKRAALSDPRGNLIYEYLRLISEVRPRYFVLENVANLATAAVSHRPIADRPGRHWSLKTYDNSRVMRDGSVRELSEEERSSSAVRRLLIDVEKLGYHVVFGVVDAADFGAPQHRLRFVMIGSRNRPCPSLPAATHGPKSKSATAFATVRNAIAHLRADPGDHSQYTPEVRQYFEMIPAGGNWRSLPAKIRIVALGEKSFNAGGGKTGFYRRLSWETPAPTITGRANRKGSALCHPESVRPLSVLECAALQGFPANWQFVGSMSLRYTQVGNAVPVWLGKAIGKAVLAHAALKSPPKGTDDFEGMLDAALVRLRASARNKKSRSSITLAAA